ncbi:MULTISPECIES: hypothetical protein [unclassified Pseudomonas]|uniref:hypothetical protein n=1 Tax=unclassified Pseudomonas TaxID=196821 RepID=UPI001CBC6266|nr:MULTISPECIES: hypothetical protein [unclassified Pseudomonas]
MVFGVATSLFFTGGKYVKYPVFIREQKGMQTPIPIGSKINMNVRPPHTAKVIPMAVKAKQTD